jgi:hypothetical protein
VEGTRKKQELHEEYGEYLSRRHCLGDVWEVARSIQRRASGWKGQDSIPDRAKRFLFSIAFKTSAGVPSASYPVHNRASPLGGEAAGS